MIQTLSIQKLQAFCGTLAMCFPNSDIAIAGGAVRDLLHDKPVKDIDCFIYMNTVKAQSRPLDQLITTWRDDDELAEEWYTGCISLADILHSEWETDGNALDVSNCKGYSYGAFSLVDFPEGLHMHPVQLVFINEHPLENVRNHFDFGLSQCWVTQAGLGWTPAYWKDRESHRITYLRSQVDPNEQRRQSSRERAERLKAKYPGWTFDRLWQLDWEPPKVEVTYSKEKIPAVAKQGGASLTGIWELSEAKVKPRHPTFAEMYERGKANGALPLKKDASVEEILAWLNCDKHRPFQRMEKK